ncbi:MAG TPA: DnaA/Hda family protein, partial [Roseiflexaceae bacterium]|nr:DnaA/Hda family protein [Roseiflexaceae bacterium]
MPFHWDVRSAIGREDFLVADSNRDAVIWLDKWPDWPQPALVLSGPEGAGKSHLARVWQKQANAQLIQAASLTLDNVPELALRPLVIEDAEGVRTEQALLHLLNMLREAGLHLLMTARQPPARWQVALPDLRSRLNALPVASLQAPDDSLIAALLVKLFADRQLRVGDDVIEFLVPRME